MSDYIYPVDALPELEYPKPPDKCCGGCCNSRITNPGASSPGLQCNLIVYLFKSKQIDNGNPQVDHVWGTCKFHGIPLKSIKDLKSILFKGAKK